MRANKYTQEFKDSTVQLVLNSDKSVLKIAAVLDVNPKTIYNKNNFFNQILTL